MSKTKKPKRRIGATVARLLKTRYRTKVKTSKRLYQNRNRRANKIRKP